MISGILCAVALAMTFAAGWISSNFRHRVERRALRGMIDAARRTGEEIVEARHEQIRRLASAKSGTIQSLDGTTGGSTMGGGKAP